MIEILDFKPIGQGSLVASFNAKMHKLGGLIFRRCKLFESKGKRWIQLPGEGYEIEGKKKHYEHIAYEDRALNDKMKEKIMHAAQEIRLKEMG